MIDAPELVTTVARRTAVVRIFVPRSEIQQVMGPAIGEVMAAVVAAGRTPTGPVFSQHHFRLDPEVVDFEVGVPVDELFVQNGRVVPSSLPAAEAARTIYRGPYDNLGPAWEEFDLWITLQGRMPGMPLWEFYAKGPESSPNSEDWETELLRPAGA